MFNPHQIVVSDIIKNQIAKVDEMKTFSIQLKILTSVDRRLVALIRSQCRGKRLNGYVKLIPVNYTQNTYFFSARLLSD